MSEQDRNPVRLSDLLVENEQSLGDSGATETRLNLDTHENPKGASIPEYPYRVRYMRLKTEPVHSPAGEVFYGPAFPGPEHLRCFKTLPEAVEFASSLASRSSGTDLYTTFVEHQYDADCWMVLPRGSGHRAW